MPCAPPADPSQPAAALADTGCMDKIDVTRFASVAWGYEVNSPLWSDRGGQGACLRAAARRQDSGVELRDAARGLPGRGRRRQVGSSRRHDAAQELRFRRQGRGDAPAGGAAGRDVGRLQLPVERGADRATLVPSAGASVTFNTGARAVDWTYPSRRDCNECHTRSAGWSLGLETAQMNRVPATAALGTQNQIDKFAAAGLFDAAPAKPYKAALVTPVQRPAWRPAQRATVTERARSYLHANCAFCHRPDGEFKTIDLRYDIDFKTDIALQHGPRQGNPERRRRDQSDAGPPRAVVTWLRMNTLEMGRMPPLASDVLDQDALALVGDWIGGIAACP